MQSQAQKWPRPQQTHRKIDQKSDWSDSDDGKDNQARNTPIVIDITSDQEADINPQPSTSTQHFNPLKKTQHQPKSFEFRKR